MLGICYADFEDVGLSTIELNSLSAIIIIKSILLEFWTRLCAGTRDGNRGVGSNSYG